MTATSRAANRLLEEKEALASAITEEVARQRLPNDEADAVAEVVKVGRSVLATPGAA